MEFFFGDKGFLGALELYFWVLTGEAQSTGRKSLLQA